MRYAIAALFCALLAAPAFAEDSLVRQCPSIEGHACILKPETRICSPSGHSCRYIGTDNYVAVRKVTGSRVLVDTVYGPASAPLNGLVSLNP